MEGIGGYGDDLEGFLDSAVQTLAEEYNVAYLDGAYEDLLLCG